MKRFPAAVAANASIFPASNAATASGWLLAIAHFDSAVGFDQAVFKSFASFYSDSFND
jgi:hypothetical protein